MLYYFMCRFLFLHLYSAVKMLAGTFSQTSMKELVLTYLQYHKNPPGYTAYPDFQKNI